jgi:hypothetical protein
MFPFNEKAYKWLKWIAIVVLPALATITGTVGLAVGWGHTEVTVIIITAADTFLGSLIGVSAKAYGKEQDEITDPDNDILQRKGEK